MIGRAALAAACAAWLAAAGCVSIEDYQPARDSGGATDPASATDPAPATDPASATDPAPATDPDTDAVPAPDACGAAAPPCALQAGVCRRQNATACTAGAWAPCTPTDYARHPLYGEVEATCDRVDNDCDGATDEELGPVCASGNDRCEPAFGEDTETCPCDCTSCGDGVCSPCGESAHSCPEDCCGGGTVGAGCGDRVCLGFACGENPQTCATDCGTTCGDGTCERGERCATCATDCCTSACGRPIVWRRTTPLDSCSMASRARCLRRMRWMSAACDHRS